MALIRRRDDVENEVHRRQPTWDKKIILEALIADNRPPPPHRHVFCHDAFIIRSLVYQTTALVVILFQSFSSS